MFCVLDRSDLDPEEMRLVRRSEDAERAQSLRQCHSLPPPPRRTIVLSTKCKFSTAAEVDTAVLNLLVWKYADDHDPTRSLRVPVLNLN
eukprot:SAG31_NODE_16978_length_688_cov_0.755518_1_plen_88_part_01